jgi:RNA polymerase sigma factor (sigma-70 family)
MKMDTVVSMGGDPRRAEYDRVVVPVTERVRRALVAQYGVEIGTDVAAEVARWSWEHLDRLASIDNLAGYLFRVGQSAVRRHRRWQRMASRFPQGGSWVAAIEPDLDDDVIDALKRLSSRQRVAVLLVHGYGFSYRDVADLLGVSDAAVTNHVHRGLTKLRQLLESTP